MQTLTDVSAASNLVAVMSKTHLQNYLKYVKDGVMLSELVPAKGMQSDLFSAIQTSPKSESLTVNTDAIKKMEKEAIKPAS
jgi:hypothetical protein